MPVNGTNREQVFSYYENYQILHGNGSGDSQSSLSGGSTRPYYGPSIFPSRRNRYPTASEFIQMRHAQLKNAWRQLNEKRENKEKDPDGIGQIFSAQTAFLGPQLWDKTLPYHGSDLKLEYMDLDEFLEENGIPLAEEQASKKSHNINLPKMTPPHAHSQPRLLERAIAPPTPPSQDSETNQMSSLGSRKPDEPVNGNDMSLALIPGEQDFDPRTRAFSEEELRPQPMIKKSKKIFVPDESKDDKYWARRKKNNISAKRSRDARRIKENQIALRAAFLEKQNDKLKFDLKQCRCENEELLKKLEKYESKA